jgi:transcriptional regulator with XRE-family HTH domain
VKTKDYCRALKVKLGVTSNYALAKALGIRRQRISNYVNGLRVFDNTTAVRVAELLGRDPMKVIADLELERGSDATLWQRIRQAVGLLLVSAGAVLVAASLPHPAYAGQGGFNITVFPAAVAMRHNAGRTTDCRRILARLLAWLRGLL